MAGMPSAIFSNAPEPSVSVVARHTEYVRLEIDGHSIEQIVQTLDSLPPVDSDVPTVVIAKTVKGKGVSFMENDVNWHAGSIDFELLGKCCAEVDECRLRDRGE